VKTWFHLKNFPSKRRSTGSNRMKFACIKLSVYKMLRGSIIGSSGVEGGGAK